MHPLISSPPAIQLDVLLIKIDYPMRDWCLFGCREVSAGGVADRAGRAEGLWGHLRAQSGNLSLFETFSIG